QPETRELFCPCHQSIFDVSDGARPIGGPATRPLPQLPLEFDAEGQLRATGGFSAPVGPAFWSER
ncbi:MAG: ubiquinol-cytochrome c reductase iron-sulfur subunit, partial [Actinomycetota bacterium]